MPSLKISELFGIVLISVWIVFVVMGGLATTFGLNREARKANIMLALQKRGLLVTMDTRCRVWMWDERLKVSLNITDKLEEITK